MGRVKATNYFPVTLLTAVAWLISFLLSLFIFNIRDDGWSRIGAFYTFTSLGAIGALMLFLYISSSPMTKDKHTIDEVFIGIIGGFILGLGLLTLLQASPSVITVVDEADIIRTFEVALTEELFWRLALPAVITSIASMRNRKGQIDGASIFFAVFISNAIFGFYHIQAFGVENSEALIGAVIAGMMQSIAFSVFLAKKYGTPAFYGIVGGHFAWNLMTMTGYWWFYTLIYLVFAIVLVSLFSVTSNRSD